MNDLIQRLIDNIIDGVERGVIDNASDRRCLRAIGGHFKYPL